MTDVPKVAQIMTKLVMTIPPEASLEEAARLLREYHVSGLPVVDTKDSVIGVISEKDIVKVLHRAAGIGHPRGLLDLVLESAPAKGESVLTICRRRLRNTRVRDAMSQPVVSVAPDTPLLEAARLMKVRGVSRLPVLDNQKRLVGLLSKSDIARDLVPKSRKARGSLHPAPVKGTPVAGKSEPYSDI